MHASVERCLAELTEVHQFTLRSLQAQGGAAGEEMLWASSMPCGLPTDETIPLGRYGSSNVGRAKSVYRMGLGHRYGRRMQTISGIHYNWSLPSVSAEGWVQVTAAQPIWGTFRPPDGIPITCPGSSPIPSDPPSSAELSNNNW